MNTGWIIQTITMLGIGMIGYFMKDLKKSIEEKISNNELSIKENTEKIEGLKEEFHKYKTEMPFHYVLRDDFIRAMSNVDKKLDKIYEIVAKEVRDR